jgi:hypothetical protein
MAEISNQQICDLLLEVSRNVADLDASVDELLIDAKAFNLELSSTQALMTQVYTK